MQRDIISCRDVGSREFDLNIRRCMVRFADDDDGNGDDEKQQERPS